MDGPAVCGLFVVDTICMTSRKGVAFGRFYAFLTEKVSVTSENSWHNRFIKSKIPKKGSRFWSLFFASNFACTNPGVSQN